MGESLECLGLLLRTAIARIGPTREQCATGCPGRSCERHVSPAGLTTGTVRQDAPRLAFDTRRIS